jgi:hypothetical protein
MAMRIALDLGLHLDQSHSVELGKMSSNDAESRRVAFWGILITNKYTLIYFFGPQNSGSDNITAFGASILGVISNF